jgi:hypothetical protein
MVEDAIAVLETAVRDIYKESQQTPAVRAALRTLLAAGVDRRLLDEFWDAAGVYREGQIGAKGHSAYQSATSVMNGICRRLGVQRIYKTIDSTGERV